jgi:hypothetical protein
MFLLNLDLYLREPVGGCETGNLGTGGYRNNMFMILGQKIQVLHPSISLCDIFAS